jgi:hypothetical protein
MLYQMRLKGTHKLLDAFVENIVLTEDQYKDEENIEL